MEAAFLAGQDLTASDLSSPITNNTLTLTNVTTGNGTLTSSYRVVGGVCIWHTYFLFGSTSSFSGSPVVELPFATEQAAMAVVGYAYAFDTSTAANRMVGVMRTATGGGTQAFPQTDGTSAWSATVPFTWATGDIYAAGGSYVIAD